MKKIGMFKLIGLCVGPVLGSGIVFLPNMALKIAGEWTFYIWIFLLTIGFFFAYICAKLVSLYPSKAGLTQIVLMSYTKREERLSAIFLIIAICLGPVMVIKTAGEYIAVFTNEPILSTIILMLLGYSILLFNIKFIGLIQFLSSTFIFILLILSSILYLPQTTFTYKLPLDFNFITTGKTLLVLFWALVGWEIVGNYSNEVRHPERNIISATVIAYLITAVTFLFAAYITQFSNDKTNKLLIMFLFEHSYGLYTKYLAIALVTALCLSTFIMIVGAGTRLLAHTIYAKSNNKGLLIIIFVHAIVISLIASNVLSEIFILKLANTFFIANILIILIAAIKVFDNLFLKLISTFVVIIFFTFALFISWYAVAIIFLVMLFYLMGHEKNYIEKYRAIYFKKLSDFENKVMILLKNEAYEIPKFENIQDKKGTYLIGTDQKVFPKQYMLHIKKKGSTPSNRAMIISGTHGAEFLFGIDLQLYIIDNINNYITNTTDIVFIVNLNFFGSANCVRTDENSIDYNRNFIYEKNDHNLFNKNHINDLNTLKKITSTSNFLTKFKIISTLIKLSLKYTKLLPTLLFGGQSEDKDLPIAFSGSKPVKSMLILNSFTKQVSKDITNFYVFDIHTGMPSDKILLITNNDFDKNMIDNLIESKNLFSLKINDDPSNLKIKNTFTVKGTVISSVIKNSLAQKNMGIIVDVGSKIYPLKIATETILSNMFVIQHRKKIPVILKYRNQNLKNMLKIYYPIKNSKDCLIYKKLGALIKKIINN